MLVIFKNELRRQMLRAAVVLGLSWLLYALASVDQNLFKNMFFGITIIPLIAIFSSSVVESEIWSGYVLLPVSRFQIAVARLLVPFGLMVMTALAQSIVIRFAFNLGHEALTPLIEVPFLILSTALFYVFRDLFPRASKEIIILALSGVVGGLVGLVIVWVGYDPNTLNVFAMLSYLPKVGVVLTLLTVGLSFWTFGRRKDLLAK